MLGNLNDLFYYLCCCFGRNQTTKPINSINHIEDLGFEEYNELVKYLKIYKIKLGVADELTKLIV